MSPPAYINNKKNILTLGEGPIQGLFDATLTAEAKYSINFTQSNRKSCSTLHHMEATVFYLLMLQKYINLRQKSVK